MSEDASDYMARVTPEIRSRITVLKLKYDTRALVAVLAHEVADMYQSLKAAGIENELSLKRIFRYLEQEAQRAPEKLPLVIEQGEPTPPNTAA